jgi:hypothetical protein
MREQRKTWEVAIQHGIVLEIPGIKHNHEHRQLVSNILRFLCVVPPEANIGDTKAKLAIRITLR